MRLTRPGPWAATCTAGTLTCPRHARRDPRVTMSLRRLRSGELVAIVGAALLVVASSTQPGGWASFGWLGLTAVLVAIVVVGAMLAATVAGRDAVAIVLAVVAVPLVFLAVVAVLVRLVGDAGWGSGAALIGALAMLGGV